MTANPTADDILAHLALAEVHARELDAATAKIADLARGAGWERVESIASARPLRADAIRSALAETLRPKGDPVRVERRDYGRIQWTGTMEFVRTTATQVVLRDDRGTMHRFKLVARVEYDLGVEIGGPSYGRAFIHPDDLAKIKTGEIRGPRKEGT